MGGPIPDYQVDISMGMEPPPDSWAAHLDELPKPGSRVFEAQNALALALIYNSMDPSTRQELQNLREDVKALASQNENLDAYAKLVYQNACQSRREVERLAEKNLAETQLFSSSSLLIYIIY